MFEQEYKEAFSKVTASEDTYRRVMNMAKEENKPRVTTAFSKVLVAAMMVTVLVVSVSASEVVRSWFASYFTEHVEIPLSTEQEAYFQEQEQHFTQSVTADGVTITLKSALTDGKKAYVCLGITAPEDVVLDKTLITGYSGEKPDLLTNSWSTDFLTDEKGNPFFGYSSMESVEDHDGRSNTQNLVIELLDDTENSDGSAFCSEKVWYMHFQDLVATYWNLSYETELINGKYKGQDNFFYTEEESKLINPQVTLAEGEWNFEIRFEDPDVMEMELVKTPVAVRVGMGWNGKGEEVFKEVKILSFVLRSFSAQVRIDDETFAPDLHDIFVVMKDGSKVSLDSEGGSPGQQDFRAELPILLEEVDYVLLPNSARIQPD